MQKKRWISDADLEEIKKLDLLTYLQNYHPEELVENGNTDYVTRTHGSLHISNGMWSWWAKGIGGKTALNYLIKVEGMEFLDAALFLKDLIKHNKPIIEVQQIRKTNYEFKLPRPNGDNSKVIKYLVHKRCIDKEIVDYCIQHYLIYESQNDHSVVFVGYDEECKAKFACIRATDSDRKQDIGGSDKRYSFSITNNSNDILHVFESAIDLLSYMTLLKQHKVNCFEDNYLSISGATRLGKDIKDSKLPIALENYLKRNKEIKKIYLHLDNDEAGQDTVKKIEYLLNDKYEIIDEHPTQCKDFNEMLMKRCSIAKDELSL